MTSSRASTTQYYLTRDRVLARIRNNGRAVPEVYNRGQWTAYPELDTLHDARPISDAEAKKIVDEVNAGTSEVKSDPDRLRGRIPGNAAEYLDGPGLSYTDGPHTEKLDDGTTITVPAPDVFGNGDRAKRKRGLT